MRSLFKYLQFFMRNESRETLFYFFNIGIAQPYASARFSYWWWCSNFANDVVYPNVQDVRLFGPLKSSRRPVNVLVGLRKDILNSSSLSLLITFPTNQSLSYSTATKSSSDKSCGVTFLFSVFCLIVLDFVGASSLQCKLNYHSEYIHCIVECNPSRLRRIFSYIFFPY